MNIYRSLDLVVRFLNDEKGEAAERLASSFLSLAEIVQETSVDSREKTIALERLEESYMWALKGLNE
jgi:hypothetical protein